MHDERKEADVPSTAAPALSPSPTGRVASPWFRDCLVEGDESELRRARALRQRSLAVSLVVQIGLLASVVIVPLFAHLSEPRLTRFIPTVPYSAPRGGTPQSRPAHPLNQHQSANSNQLKYTQVLQPWKIPTDVGHSSDRNSAPEAGRTGTGEGPSGPLGLPGGIGPELGGRPPIVEAQQVKPKPPAKAIRVSEPVQLAMLIHRVEPVYPALAIQARLEGTVRLHAIVGRDGVVRDLEALSGHPILVRAALDAVRQWRYRPTLLDGKPMEVDTYITVIFQLRQ